MKVVRLGICAQVYERGMEAMAGYEARRALEEAGAITTLDGTDITEWYLSADDPHLEGELSGGVMVTAFAPEASDIDS